MSESPTSTSQLLAESKGGESSTFISQGFAAPPVSGSAIPAQQTAIEYFDELELPISSAVWGVTIAGYMNEGDEVTSKITQLEPVSLLPVLGDSAAHKVFGIIEWLEFFL